jgi:DNA-binding NarL/FixJ family response regulator
MGSSVIEHEPHTRKDATRIGVMGGSPVTIAGIHRALGPVGIPEIITVEHPGSVGERVDPLAGLVVFADEPERFEVIRTVRRRLADLPVIALVTSAVTCYTALAAGASSVARCDSPLGEIARIVDSCLAGQPVLPTDLALELLTMAFVPIPSTEELTLLCLLANGANMRAAADQVGYSERHVYRVLNRLCKRLGVATKETAIDLARARGWLDTGIVHDGPRPAAVGPVATDLPGPRAAMAPRSTA